MDEWDRESDKLERQRAAGEISSAEYSAAILRLNNDYRSAAEAAAGEAYQQELQNW